MMRALPGQVRDLLELEAENFIAEREVFEARRAVNEVDAIAESRWLASSFERASDWFARQAEAFDPNDHGEAIFWG